MVCMQFNVQKAIGFEASPYRARIARMRVKKEQFDNKISIVQKDMYKADLTKADVIFHIDLMLKSQLLD